MSSKDNAKVSFIIIQAVVLPRLPRKFFGQKDFGRELVLCALLPLLCVVFLYAALLLFFLPNSDCNVGLVS